MAPAGLADRSHTSVSEFETALTTPSIDMDGNGLGLARMDRSFGLRMRDTPPKHDRFSARPATMDFVHGLPFRGILLKTAKMPGMVM